MTIPLLYQIIDNRNVKSFNKNTFSNFLKNEVNKEFQKSIVESKIEECCNWGVELVVSGQCSTIYDKIIHLSCKLIHINNPRLPNLLLRRLNFYKNILKNIYSENNLLLRNDQNIRNHIAELSIIICKSNKTKPLNLKKLKPIDFNINVFKKKLIHVNDTYIKNLSRPGDPNELILVLNEFYHELQNKNYDKCVYWLSWLNDWEKKIIKKEGKYGCGYRELTNIDQKFFTDYIWFVWEIILKEGFKNHNDIVNKQVQALYKLYKIDFTNGKKTKKVCFMLNSIKYFTDFYDIHTPIIKEYNLIIQATGNINYMYNLRKQFEIKDKSNMTQKLNKLDEILQQKETKVKKKKIKLNEDSEKKLELLLLIDKQRLNMS